MEAELTPLESAINVLEMIKTEFTLTEAVVESSRKLVKEAVRLYFSFFFLLTRIKGFWGYNTYLFVWGREKWMKRANEHTHTHPIDITSSGDPFSAQTWKEPLMVGVQLLWFWQSSLWLWQEGSQYTGNGLILKTDILEVITHHLESWKG